jgi:helix-turn-helix protein
MADQSRIRDRSSLHQYRIEVPNLIDDMGLSVYEFRVYVRLKRVAQDEGSCWQSTRTLATACGMSPGQVAKAKDELERRGLITRKPKPVRGGYVDDVTIVDVWPQNFRTYAPEHDPDVVSLPESDRHTNTSSKKVIATRTLPKSDRHTNTSSESDRVADTLSSKRSHSERKKDSISSDHDSSSSVPPAKTNDDDETVSFLRSLNVACAEEFAGLPIGPVRERVKQIQHDPKWQPGAIVNSLRKRPPRAAPKAAPAAPTWRPPADALTADQRAEKARALIAIGDDHAS